MPKIISLICKERDAVLSDAFLKKINAPLTHKEFRILAPMIAVEWRALSPDDTHQLWQARLDGAPVDINIIEDENREKRLLIADMDSTMIEQECIDELADFAGRRAEIAKITERAMRGELDFEDALKARVSMLAGLAIDTMTQTLSQRITYTPGGKTLITTMRARGAYTALVSGGFEAFTESVAAHLGFDEHHGNYLHIKDAQIVGTVRLPILGRDAKAQRLKSLVKECAITAHACLAVGDGANDLAMIDLAGMGVAFHAKPATAKAARYRLNHADLTGLLYLQGIAKSDHCAV